LSFKWGAGKGAILGLLSPAFSPSSLSSIPPHSSFVVSKLGHFFVLLVFIIVKTPF